MENKNFILNEDELFDLRNFILDAQYKVLEIENKNPTQTVVDAKNYLHRALQMVGINRCVDCERCNLERMECYMPRDYGGYMLIDLSVIGGIKSYGCCPEFKNKNQKALDNDEFMWYNENEN
ncbi:MAG: hypothetical protein MJ237_09640 [bacterium]|nr:hypothetical protein [bacterium]